MRFLLLTFLATFACVIACNGINTPPTGPGTDYPCGVWGVVCAEASTVPGVTMCCPQASICGYSGPFSRCPAGSCCDEGDDSWWDNDMVSKSPKGKSPTPQLKTFRRGTGQ